MKELVKDSADHLVKFGKLFKNLLGLQFLLLILSLGVGYIPIEIWSIIALIILRITSITMIVIQSMMAIQVNHVKKTFEEKNLPLSLIFFVGMILFSIIENILSVLGAFVDIGAFEILTSALGTALVSFEILFWVFFYRFLVRTEIYLLEKLLKHVKILIILIMIALAINIIAYFTFLLDLLGLILLFIALAVGITRFVYQLKIANGLIENFTWNN